MNKHIKLISVLTALLLLVCCAAGCSESSAQPTESVEQTQSESPEPSPTETAEETPEQSEEPEPSPAEPDYIILGEETADSEQAILENETELTIFGVAVKLSDDEDFGDNLLPENTEFKNGEFAKLFCDPVKFNTDTNVENARDDAVENENEDGISEDEVEFNEYYDIKLTCDNEKEYILYDFSFDNIDEAQILFSQADDVCYLIYTSVITDETVNTLEAQKAMKEADGEDEAVDQEDTEQTSSDSISETSSNTKASNKSNSTSAAAESDNTSAAAESDNTSAAAESDNTSAAAEDEDEDEPEEVYIPAPDPEPEEVYVPDPEPVYVPDPEPAPEQYVDDCLEENVDFNY